MLKTTTQEMTRLIENMDQSHGQMFERPLNRLRRNLVPHCDCEEGNRVAGLVKLKMDDRETCHDDAWVMIPTEINQNGLCSHCNYVPLYQEASK